MTLPMARDLARHNIRVATISPSPFTTALTAQFKPEVERAVKRQALLYPRRYGHPEEFANTVKFIFQTPYINGEVFKLTGGTRVPVRM
jgi:3-hydroxyacyl-CoA dehydrogenase / 3-hydroxy-2-methylbutyryl-CoA dehydrogenase